MNVSSDMRLYIYGTYLQIYIFIYSYLRIHILTLMARIFRYTNVLYLRMYLYVYGTHLQIHVLIYKDVYLYIYMECIFNIHLYICIISSDTHPYTWHVSSDTHLYMYAVVSIYIIDFVVHIHARRLSSVITFTCKVSIHHAIMHRP
jgi:hypothetical protein